MLKGMMGPEHGAKAVFGSAKAGQTQRQKRGRLETAKLPTSIEELHDVLLGERGTAAADEDGLARAQPQRTKT